MRVTRSEIGRGRGRRRGLPEVVIIANTNMVYVVNEERLGIHKAGNMRAWHSTFEWLDSYFCARARIDITCIR